jgi:hypothetical protein
MREEGRYERVLVSFSSSSFPPLSLLNAAKEKNTALIFMTVSFVGAEAFASALGTKTYNVFVTQCVPLPTGSTVVAQKFRTALTAYDSTVDPGFVNFEGCVHENGELNWDQSRVF